MAGKQKTEISRVRLIVLTVFMLVFWVVLEAQLFRWQITWHETLSEAGKKQYEKRVTLPAKRGDICDRNGKKFAIGTIHYDLAADPEMVRDKNMIARKCAETLSESYSHYYNLLNGDGRFEYLERKAPGRDIQPILDLKDPGLIKIRNFRREYPYGRYAAHLIGITDPDDDGLSGLELQYDKELKGEDGEAVLQYDNKRRMFYNADYPLRWPKDGVQLFLTIDKNIQTVAEQELDRGIQDMRAKAGMVVIMDPFSGAILAMANYPSFDPNNHGAYDADSKRNRTITDVYEPGSTLKIIGAAALLQEHLKRPEDIVYCERGRYLLHNRYFHDTRKYGWLSFRRVIEKSSNIGMIKLMQAIPEETFYKYLKHFGFGNETSIGLIGENSGILRPPVYWSKLSRASISIGYEIGVTAVQMVTAYSAIVNGGYLYQPYVVSHTKSHDGAIRIVHQPKVIRPVISPKVSEILKSFMGGVVERGTGIKAAPDGVKVGGKTGTAIKMNPETGVYYDNRYVASFCGFAPYEKPKYVCLVVIDEPHDAKYGGDAAAPVFRKIISRIIRFDNSSFKPNPVPEELDIKFVEKMNTLPGLEGFKINNALSLIKSKDLDYKIKGQGNVVAKVLAKNDEVILELGRNQVKMERVPKLVGLSTREALTKIDLSQVRVRIIGNGIIRRQSPQAGSHVNSGSELVLTCN